MKAIIKKETTGSEKKNMIFHQDTTGMHASLVVRQKWLPFGWEVFTHLSYTPDIALSHDHLF